MAGRDRQMSPLVIFGFVPNLIGYFRIALSLLAYAVAASHPALCLLCYSLSFILDAADGTAARALQQCSHMGAILDMLVDRASTAGLLVILAGVVRSPSHWHAVMLASLAFIDVGSHFCRMYASLFAQKESHKDVSDSIFWLLRQYYSKRRFMGVLCIGQEFFLIFLYAAHMYTKVTLLGPLLRAAVVICAVPCALKQVVNVQQLIDGLYHIACVDAAERAGKAQ